ncbi:ATP-binding protein [Patescibacteria group bacterium]
MLKYTNYAIEERIEAQMESVLMLKINQLNRFTEEEKEDFNNIADFLLELSDYENFYNYENLSESLESILEKEEDFFELFIMDLEGRVIVSTDKIQEEKLKFNEEYFIEGQKGVYIQSFYYDVALQQPASTIVVPIQTKTDIYILAGRIDMNEISEIMTERSGLGETGETYLVNKFNFMITESRFEENVSLKKTVYTEGVGDCLQAHGDIGHGHYLDYRDADVIGMYKWLPNMEVCILAEINEDEAHISINKMRNTIVISSLGAITIILIFIFIFGGRITSRLNNLRNAAIEISKGDLKKRIKIKSKDEIGDLAVSFNTMTKNLCEAQEKLNKYNKTLEGKVRQRTKELAQERNKLRTTLESIGDGAFVIDKKGIITFFNNVAESITQYKSKEAVGKYYKEIINLVREKDEKEITGFIEFAIKKNKITPLHNHTVLITKKKKRVPVLSSAAPIHGDRKDKIVGSIVTFRDVSYEREVEKMKDDFIALASHQLRTPLTSIKWSLEELLSEGSRKTKLVQKDYLENSYKATNRMVRLTNSILNISRIDSGKLTIFPESIDLVQFTKEALHKFQSLIKDREHKVKTSFPKKVMVAKTDPRILSEVLSTVISNALRYTPKKGVIEINLEVQKTYVEFNVKDNGIGIPEKATNKVFQRFFRADNAERIDTEGTGLALSITKNLVEILGGKIKFKSKENSGTTFTFTLPLKGIKAKKGEKGLS